jgi:hypothetical protein
MFAHDTPGQLSLLFVGKARSLSYIGETDMGLADLM